MIPGSANPLLLASAAAAGPVQIERSLRFNSSDSAFCSRTPAVAGNRNLWTLAFWIKRCKFGTAQDVFSVGTSGTDILYFDSSDRLCLDRPGATVLVTTQVFRDPSAWYHIALRIDSTNGTNANKAQLYVNGSEVTTFSTDNRSGLTSSSFLTNTAILHTFGIRSSNTSTNPCDIYLADIYMVDGSSLAPSSFTEVSATTGQLIPKAYTGSYNTNGFHLPFSDNSTTAALGTDTSGNGNTWTVTNMSALSGTVDSAGGAKPVQNTTDAYGLVAGSGARTDALSANLQIALPLYTSITDLSPLAQATTSTTGNTALTFQTSSYKFYGGSMVSTSTGASYGTRVNFNSTISLPSGGWTVEFFAKITNISPNGNSVTVKNSSGAVLDLYHYDSSNSYLIEVYFNGTGSKISGSNTASTYLDWNHYAICYNGSTASLYINGISVGTNSSNIPTQATMFELAGTGWSGNTSYVTDFRIYSSAKYTGNFSIPNRSIAAGNDSLVDTPTSIPATDTGVGGEVRGNYCTLNPLRANSSHTLSNGNLDVSLGGAGATTTFATFGVSTGKWYWEMTCGTQASYYPSPGVNTNLSASVANQSGVDATGYQYMANGQKFNSSVLAAYGASFTTNDVIGIALDMDAGTITFYKNGASQGQAYSGITGTAVPTVIGLSASAVFNAGQRAFAYTAPSGFKALCDTNLGAPLVAKPNTLMDVVKYDGNGSTQTISGLGFSPDLVWIKSRSGADNHAIQDAVRGATYVLQSNTTNAEVNAANTVGSFTSDGFSLAGNAGSTNGSSVTYVAWAWDAGTSTDPSNTAGSITSQVRANVSAGFSVVTVSKTGTGTVGHGLGIKPELIILKSRADVDGWYVHHSTLASNQTLFLNTTGAIATSTGYWNNTLPTSTVFSVGSAIPNSNLVAYCFAPVAGYSSFGAWVGSGTTNDGAFIYTGFRPRFILLKNSDNVEQWFIYDSARRTYNVQYPDPTELRPNSSAAEGSYSLAVTLDFLSNGFKIRGNTGAEISFVGRNYIYCAWAESPFQYARAR